MRECPDCKELNGDNNEYCYKCKAWIGPVEIGRRRCPKCDIAYPPSKTYCDVCGESLLSSQRATSSAKYRNAAKNYSSGGETELWMLIISFLIPIAGIVLGCIKVSQKDNDGAKKIFIATIASIVLYFIVVGVLINRSTAELDAVMSDLQSYTDY